MGLFRVRVQVFNLEDRTKTKEVDVVVDTRATYPVVPQSLADELGLRVAETRTFTLANGVAVTRGLTWAGLSFDGRSTPSLVVLGVERDIPILGAFALEGLGLEVDPVAKTLRPAPQFLLASSTPDTISEMA